MKYQIISTPVFDKQIKALNKKYPSIKQDITRLFGEILKNPQAGKLLFDDVYKIRMAITSKGKGKSGGARVIYFNMFAKRADNNTIAMLSIYDKSEHETITDKQIREALEYI